MADIKQHSVMWYKNKATFLGANDVACLLNNGYSDKDDLIERKISYTQETFDEDTTKLLERGTKYEPIVRELCGIRNSTRIAEVGQRFHPTLKFLTASPDGIIGDNCLVEFKVRKRLSYQILFKFWIQMQIQMEVWNIDSCLFCENLIYEYSNKEEYLADSGTDKPRGELRWNEKTYYWKLDNVYEQTVSRNRHWFAKMLPEIKEAWQTIETGRKPTVPIAIAVAGTKRSRGKSSIPPPSPLPPPQPQPLNERQLWQRSKPQHITQHNLTNWTLDDPVLDWFQLYQKRSDRDEFPSEFDLASFIYEQAVSFKLTMRDYLKERTPESMFVDIDEWYHPIRSTDYSIRYNNQHIYFDGVVRTQKAIDEGVPIIFNACLADKDRYFYGKADILVKAGTLLDLIQMDDIFIEGELDHYIIVSTKFATLNLCADGMTLLSNAKQKIYKIQSAFLNVCLSKMQGRVSCKALIIGRKSQFTSCGKTTKSDNCFARVGVVDFAERDANWLTMVDDAIAWIKLVREPSAKQWTVDPPSRKELAPNMKNQRDHPWHDLKKTLAMKNNEITLMYRCGPKKRNHAWDQADTECWMDLTAEAIDVKGRNTLKHIENFIESNTEATNLHLDRIEAIKHIGVNGKSVDLVVNMPIIEFFVDFEAVNDLGDDFSLFPTAGGCAIIYMIGCLMVNNKTNQQIHNTFIVDRLNKECETRVVNDWISSMKTMSNGQTRNIYVYHWGNAEKWMLTRALSAREIADNGIILIDLCEAFRNAFSAVNGTFGYGIKQIGKALFKAGKVKTTWTDSTDGGAAMVAGWKAEEICNRVKCKFTEVGFIKDMIKYNYIDCKVMQEIIDHLRQGS